MKKCPVCNSSKYRESLREKKAKCEACGYIRKLIVPDPRLRNIERKAV